MAPDCVLTHVLSKVATPGLSVFSKQWKLVPTAIPSAHSLMWKGPQIALPASWWSVCVCLGVITTAAFYVLGLSVCLLVVCLF